MAAPVRSSTDAAATVVADLHRRVSEEHGVALPLRLWTGQELGPTDLGFRIVLRRPWSLRQALTPPDELSIGEAYLDDLLDVEGSMVAALRSLASLRDLGRSSPSRVGLLTALARLPAPPREGRRHRPRRSVVSRSGRAHSRRRDAAAIRHHYDVGNSFYRLFLDDQLVYSCAVFAEEDRSLPVTDRAVLNRAQVRKLDLVCRKLHLKPGDRMLDVGCGWGALVLHAADHYGVRAVGVTLSPAQADLARQRVAEAGLQDRVCIELTDYRDVDGEFDAIASVGMVEHVGADHLDTYARALHMRLAPGGRLLNQGITTGQRDLIRDFSRPRQRSFIASYVFPDGALVPAHHMARILEQAGFELWDLQQLRPHYSRTLAHWVANLESNAEVARARAGERTYRVWRTYMAGASVGFDVGDLGVVQILAVKPPTRLPFGRDWMQPRL